MFSQVECLALLEVMRPQAALEVLTLLARVPPSLALREPLAR